jgi:hypothetical protein
MMINKGQKYPVELLNAVVISSLLLLAISFGGTVNFQEISGQQQEQQQQEEDVDGEMDSDEEEDQSSPFPVFSVTQPSLPQKEVYR